MIWCLLVSKSAALLAAVYVDDFPKNKCKFSAQNKLDIVPSVSLIASGNKEKKNVAGSNSSQGGAR